MIWKNFHMLRFWKFFCCFCKWVAPEHSTFQIHFFKIILHLTAKFIDSLHCHSLALTGGDSWLLFIHVQFAPWIIGYDKNATFGESKQQDINAKSTVMIIFLHSIHPLAGIHCWGGNTCVWPDSGRAHVSIWNCRTPRFIALLQFTLALTVGLLDCPLSKSSFALLN